MHRAAALLVLVSLAIFAQQPRRPAPAKPAAAKPAAAKATPAVQTIYPIEQLLITGNKLYPSESILSIAALQVGETGNEEKFKAARDRLVDTGAFENVGFKYEPGPTGKGYAVTFEVDEIEQVIPFRLERLPLPDDEIRAVLNKRFPLFTEKLPATKSAMEQFRKTVYDLLATKQESIEVSTRVLVEQQERMFVLFSPNGLAPAVAEIYFTGNSVLTAEQLQKAVSGAGVGVEFRETRFREILDASIRPLYEVRGRIRVAFPKIEQKPATDVSGLRIEVQVSEGESYNFGTIKVQGSPFDAELIKETKIEDGDMANMELVDTAQTRIHKAMQRSGFMKVTETVERIIDDAKHTVGITFQVTPGPQFTFAKLILQGLDIHSEAEIRRKWALAAGKPFNAEYPDYFIARVKEDGVFENLGEKTKAVITLNEKNTTADVTLHFVGDPPVVKKTEF
jgi:outer membrane protein insertion porin family